MAKREPSTRRNLCLALRMEISSIGLNKTWKVEEPPTGRHGQLRCQQRNLGLFVHVEPSPNKEFIQLIALANSTIQLDLPGGAPLKCGVRKPCNQSLTVDLATFYHLCINIECQLLDHLGDQTTDKENHPFTDDVGHLRCFSRR